MYDGNYWIGQIRLLATEFGIQLNERHERLFNDYKDNDTPASTRHHLNRDWGCWEHTHNVIKMVLALNKQLLNSTYSPNILFDAALCHDLAKFSLGVGKKTLKSGPNKGQTRMTWNELKVYDAHGIESYLLGSKYFEFDLLQKQAIIYHMGPKDYDLIWHDDKMTKMTWLLHISDNMCAQLIEPTEGQTEDGE